MHIFDFSETFLVILVPLVVFLGVKFGFRKSCLCKRNDKYEVWAKQEQKSAGRGKKNIVKYPIIYICSLAPMSVLLCQCPPCFAHFHGVGRVKDGIHRAGLVHLWWSSILARNAKKEHCKKETFFKNQFLSCLQKLRP